MELVIFARFHAREGQEAAVAAALREVSGPTQAEPGCRFQRAYRSIRDSRLFFIHSRWTDEAGSISTPNCRTPCASSRRSRG